MKFKALWFLKYIDLHMVFCYLSFIHTKKELELNMHAIITLQSSIGQSYAHFPHLQTGRGRVLELLWIKPKRRDQFWPGVQIRSYSPDGVRASTAPPASPTSALGVTVNQSEHCSHAYEWRFIGVATGGRGGSCLSNFERGDPQFCLKMHFKSI